MEMAQVFSIFFIFLKKYTGKVFWKDSGNFFICACNFRTLCVSYK